MWAVTFLSNSGDVKPLGVRYSVQRDRKFGGSCVSDPLHPPPLAEVNNCNDAASNQNIVDPAVGSIGAAVRPTSAICLATSYMAGDGTTAYCNWNDERVETDDDGKFRAPVIGWKDMAADGAPSPGWSYLVQQDSNNGYQSQTMTDGTSADVLQLFTDENAKPGVAEVDAVMDAASLAVTKVLGLPYAATGDAVTASWWTVAQLFSESGVAIDPGNEYPTNVLSKAEEAARRAGIEILAGVIGKDPVNAAYLAKYGDSTLAENTAAELVIDNAAAPGGLPYAESATTNTNIGWNNFGYFFLETAGGGRRPLVIATEGVKGTEENAVCSNRGLCDYDSGLCKCFNGFTEDDCSVQNALAMY
jgi:hypothetical protein